MVSSADRARDTRREAGARTQRGGVEAGPVTRQRKWKTAFLAQEEGKTYGSNPEPTEAEKYLAKGFWVLRGWGARSIDGVHPPSRRKCLQELGGGKIRRGYSGFVVPESVYIPHFLYQRGVNLVRIPPRMSWEESFMEPCEKCHQSTVARAAEYLLLLC